MEYSGNTNGNQNYQNPIITQLQSNNPLTSQWSTIDLVVETVIDGITNYNNRTYYLRDSLNSRTLGTAEASFSFVFLNTLAYADQTNSFSQNGNTLLRNTNYALFIETIK